MRDFDLVSVDWNSVNIMLSSQFRWETSYLEELARWTLQRGRVAGVLQLAEHGISQPTPEGRHTYSITVQGCCGVGPEGYIIEIPDNEQYMVRDQIQATEAITPVYIGVSKVAIAGSASLEASDAPLKCRGMHRQYRIATHNHDSGMDWLQIAQFNKIEGTSDRAALLQRDPQYLPECLFLGSDVRQWNMVQEVTALAREALELLCIRYGDTALAYGAATALAGSLGAASYTLNRNLFPRAYLDRLAGVFSAQRAQLSVLPHGNLTSHADAVQQLEATCAYFAGARGNMGWALNMAKECFQRLIKLYPELLQHLGTPPPSDRSISDHEISAPLDTPPRRGLQ